MIGVKVNGIFLDLKPGTTGEIENKSPFFAINDFTQEYSTPLSFQFTENNCNALGWVYQYYNQRQKIKVQAELYDNHFFLKKAVLVIETGKLDINNLEAGEMNGFLLFGVSRFFQDIKDKKLTQLSLGGTRTYPFTTNNPTDGSNGFWQHLHNTWDGTYDYVFQPVRNEMFSGTIEWLNKLDANSQIEYDFFNQLIPSIRIQYLLEKIFTEHGWIVDFTGINDADWTKLFMHSLKPLDWANVNWVYDGGLGFEVPNFTQKSLVNIALKKHVPDKLISDFLVQFFNRYGIAPIFNNTTRNCSFVSVKELRNAPAEDYTAFAQPLLKTSFNKKDNIYAFTNEIDTNDNYPITPDFNNREFLTPVNDKSLLPTPTGNDSDKLIYLLTENQWWQIQLNDTTNQFEWVYFADNIFNEEPENNTDTIATDISTLPNALSEYRVASSITYYGVFPIMKQDANKAYSYRTFFYHGLVTETKEDGTAGPNSYPFASANYLLPASTPSTAWSNVYKQAFNGADTGIITYWWKDFLDIVNNGEDVETTLHLSLVQLQQLSFNKILLIQQIPYILVSYLQPMPYKGFIVAQLKRLVKPTIAVTTPSGEHIYAKLDMVNIVNNGSDPYGLWTDWTTCDVQISLFEDALGTIPYTPLGGVTVVVKETLTINAGAPIETNTNYTVNYSVEVIKSPAFYGGTFISTGDDWQTRYSLETDPSGYYIVI